MSYLSVDESGEDYDYPDEVESVNQEKLERLKRERSNVNWEIEEMRIEFLREMYAEIKFWKGQLPNFRDIFRKEEIDCLLSDSINFMFKYQIEEGSLRYREGEDPWYNDAGERFIRFVARSGYRDEPNLDEDGRPLLRRTTALHTATKRKFDENTIILRLFTIYNRFDLNFTDEFGHTHFHVACEYGCFDIVKKFLELGQDPNCLEYVTGNSPLHSLLAGDFFDYEVFQLLLESSANPNVANTDGVTPLHIMCRREQLYEEDYAKMFFEITDDKHQTVQVNVKDNFNRTPLQLAVANLLPNTVDVLLEHGADLSSFVFPTLGYFTEGLSKEEDENSIVFKMKLASGALQVTERLEKRGYELNRSDALTIMSLFATYSLFKMSSNLEKAWYDNEKFARKAKQFKILPKLSLYDLIQLRPEEASKQLNYTQYFRLAESGKLCCLPEGPSKDICTDHLCEKLSRRFFLHWAVDSFVELTHYRLPILCCEMIIEELKNVDLWRICLAVKK